MSTREPPPLTSFQIRAARAILKWNAHELARASALGINTIKRAEVAEETTALTVANDRAVRRALENAGVEFIDENGGGPGVRLRKSKPPQIDEYAIYQVSLIRSVRPLAQSKS